MHVYQRIHYFIPGHFSGRQTNLQNPSKGRRNFLIGTPPDRTVAIIIPPGRLFLEIPFSATSVVAAMRDHQPRQRDPNPMSLLFVSFVSSEFRAPLNSGSGKN